MMRAKTKSVSAAIITIKDADKMTPAGRKRIAEWLRMHARYLVQHGKQYNSIFRGRYLYESKER